MIVQTELVQNRLAVLTLGDSDFPTITDTDGDTVVVYFTKHDTDGALPVKVETDGVGAAPGTDLALNCDLTLLTDGVGFYEVEVIADENGTNPKPLLPNEKSGYPYIVEIVDFKSIT